MPGVIQTGSIPILMNNVADEGVQLTMACQETAMNTVLYKEFVREGAALNAASFIQQDFEPGGPMEQWVEQTAIPTQQFFEGYPLKLTVQFYCGKFMYSYQTYKLGKKELMAQGPKLLSDSEIYAREIKTHLLLVYGHLAQSAVPSISGIPMVATQTGDLQPLFSASHRWRSTDAFTMSNLLSVYVHPTQTGVHQINKQIGRYRQPNNDIMGLKVRKLIVPLELALLVNVFKASDGNPLDNTNAKNLFNQMVPDGCSIDDRLPSTSDYYWLTNNKAQLPIMRDLEKATPWKIDFSDRTLDSGVGLRSAFAFGPSVAGFLGIGKVTGTPGTIANSLL